MSLTLILADYFAGSISTSDALRRSGFREIDDLVSAVKVESETRARQRAGTAGRSHATKDASTEGGDRN